ncbi:hypothetical protein Dda_6527 [Drechslerella dactyloides]|uniref:Uncharacterized protein n=1 Tax=Drechslerella dactyloides TaxID=74499 RepID=A0AAD6ITP4_DREDA|nr:hypothetical protein Dda_6527 [Drechslerella dactyloides]
MSLQPVATATRNERSPFSLLLPVIAIIAIITIAIISSPSTTTNTRHCIMHVDAARTRSLAL